MVKKKIILAADLPNCMFKYFLGGVWWGGGGLCDAANSLIFHSQQLSFPKELMTHLLSRTECYWNNCNDLITLKVIIFNK